MQSSSGSLPWQYPALIVGAMLASGWLLRRSQKTLPIARWQKVAIGCAAFIGAMLGAKLPFVLGDWNGLWDGSAWFAHGKTIMTGLAGGYLAVEIAKWTLDVRVKTGDTFAIPVALAVAIGRVACFEAGCCYGLPTAWPWGVAFPSAGDALRRHPTQLYETAFHLALAALLWSCQRQLERRTDSWAEPLRGQLVKLYILAYLAYRFGSEFLRPEPHWLGGLTVYQWTALALAPIFIVLWLRDASSPCSERRRSTSESRHST
ncbi:MAG: prolipoprotein diacylglyceryl transferase family protein [Pirellulales bacterium]